MKTLISCAYNMVNCCVELKFTDGSMLAIDTIAVENEVARNMYERSELDYLIYNDPRLFNLVRTICYGKITDKLFQCYCQQDLSNTYSCKIVRLLTGQVLSQRPCL